ncbi:hypothetical protein GCM10009544_59330 [Streptomyces stramineus]|uniref:Uncharacterized protein n=1 Tax=Streptomyces stramineus TaxID=173861 RepID=A0ABP3L0L7_9ACTN
MGGTGGATRKRLRGGTEVPPRNHHRTRSTLTRSRTAPLPGYQSSVKVTDTFSWRMAV